MSLNKVFPNMQLSNILILNLDQCNLLENDGLGYCLMFAFLHGLHGGRESVIERNTYISEAMKFVVDHEEQARDRKLSSDSLEIIGKWYGIYTNPIEKVALKPGEFWTYELLEFYIQMSQLEVQIYYFREYIPNQYVLIKTRHSMARNTEYKVITILEKMDKHKLQIKKIVADVSVEDLIDNTNFDVLIDTNDDLAPYDDKTFIPINICKRAKLTEDVLSGYASIGKSIGRPTADIIKELADQYLKEFKDQSNSEKFIKGRALSAWLQACEEESMPDDLRLTLDDCE